MKLALVVLAFAAVACAAPAEEKQVPQIIRSDFESKPDGGYVLSLETDDGTIREEVGELKEALDEENKPHSVVVVRGSFSYKKEDGTVETISYYADETGFHAEGESIPKQEAVAVARR